MFRRSSRPIATLFGIPLHLHWSAVLTAGFVAMSTPAIVGLDGSLTSVLLIGGLAAFLFGSSLIVHEYSHALMARRRGIGVRRVSMWALGGVAELEVEPRRWQDELAVSVVGPLASLAIGVVTLGAALGVAAAGFGVPARLFAWLAIVNVGLGIFNLLPGFPLDGGRVLHSLIWWRTGNRHRSTVIAANSGRVVGGLVIALGVVTMFLGGSGFLTALIGWFIMSSAAQARAQAQEALELAGVRAGDIARPLPMSVNADLSIDDFVHYWLPANPSPTEVILLTDHDQRATGLVPMAAVAAVAPMSASGVPMSALAIPATSLGVVSPSTDLGDAFAASPSGFILVSEPDRLVGYITPRDLRRTAHPTPTPAGTGVTG